MLINLSNHPSSTWPQNQIETAQNAYGRVTDLAFPTIPPEAEETTHQQLVEEYFHKITELAPRAVHLMGELTFCYRLVDKLKSAGIEVIASTTNRQVTYDDAGNKISTFEFVQFRKY